MHQADRLTPQLLIPAYVEQAALAYNFCRSGAALMMGAKENAAGLSQALTRLIGESQFRSAAGALAARYVGFDQGERVGAMCDTLGTWA